MTDNVPRGPLGDARPEATDKNIKTSGTLRPEKVEDRENVGTVKPEDYPLADRDAGNAAANRGARAGTGADRLQEAGREQAVAAIPRIMIPIRKAAVARLRLRQTRDRLAVPTLLWEAATRFDRRTNSWRMSCFDGLLSLPPLR